MLYISRFFGEDYVGIVDTDDDVEECISTEELTLAVSSGVDIEGVYLEDTAYGTTEVAGVIPWSGLRLKTVEATKLYAVFGVDIRVYKNGISCIRWLPAKLTAPVTLRLSDFGDKLYPGFLNWDAIMSKRPQLFTVIVDDKVKIFPDAFRFLGGWANEIGGCNLCVDISEATDVSSVYHELGMYVFTAAGRKRIKLADKPERYARYEKNSRRRRGYL